MNERLQELLKQHLDRPQAPSGPSCGGTPVIEANGALFAQYAKTLKDAGVRLVAEWASDESPFGKGFAVYAAYNEGESYFIVKSSLTPGETSFPTITKYYPAAYRFERQIASLMGLTPEGHPDMRPWIKHEHWPQDAYPLRKSFDGNKPLERVKGEYKWIRTGGEGVFEIPVGPVHAGIIEPGHFRFQAVGEDIINLEERLGYVHKGIEKRFESLPWGEAARLAARVSGDSTVAHTIAFCAAVEEAALCTPPERAMFIRAIMMETERIANHLCDIGAICNDTGMALLNYQFSILRERVLRTSLAVFGHRLMMDRVVLGGVSADITKEGSGAILNELTRLFDEFERLVRIYEDNPSLEDRIYGTGILTPQTSKDLGVVGYVGRASGQAVDARLQKPMRPYERFAPKKTVLTSGDVHARAWVRIEETRDSIRLIREMLRELPEGPISTECAAPLPGKTGFSAVEGWRGEIIYWVECAPDGSINRCMVRDPSSVNWIALEQAIKGGNIVPDFPLCNKSFNQSYSGHDL